jgi:hypothetical protein
MGTTMPRKEPNVDPVSLIYFDRRWKNGLLEPTRKEFSSLEAAIQHVCNSIGSPRFHDPFIVERANHKSLLWEPRFGIVTKS